MAEIDLTNQHPEYQETLDSRTKSRDLYEGWRAVKAKTETYLFKEPRELDEEYDIRIARAVLDNWVEKVVQARQSVIFRKAPKRELSAPLQPFLEDVDRNGTSADSFFESSAFESQVDGIHWVLIDMPPAPEGGFVSRADEVASQQRPFFQQVPAASVIDWEIAPDGNLAWLVISQSRMEVRESPGVATKIVAQFKIWYRDRWEVYESTGDGKEAKTVLVQSGVNTSLVVPLVPFFGVKNSEQSGWPVIDKLIEHIVLIYNKRSDLDRSERITAHPVPYVISPDKPELLNMANGIWINSKDAGGNPVEVGILETSGAAFDSIRESIRDLIQTIQSNALAQAKKDSAQVESADSQKEYRKAFNSSLRSASVNYEASERRCWEIAGLWIGNLNPNVVEYNRDFDDATIGEVMIEKLSNLAGGKAILTRKTLFEILQKGEIIDPALDADTEIAALDAEDSAATQALAKSLVPVAANMPPEPLQ